MPVLAVVGAINTECQYSCGDRSWSAKLWTSSKRQGDGVGDEKPDSLVGLAAAIEALRDELTAVWTSSAHRRLWFRPVSVELTVQAAVTKTGKGNAGIKWWLVELGGERSAESATTQTLKLALEPVGVDPAGELIDVLISDPDLAVPGDLEQPLEDRG